MGGRRPRSVGRSAYTYGHIPLVAGIIVAAVGDELAIAHPLGPVTAGTALTVLGGPALFLAGHAVFQRVVFGRIPASRLVAIAVLVVAAPVVLVASSLVPPLALAVLAAVVVGGAALWDSSRSAHPA
ncbi:low temperature requirement protein A [Nonomuraea sp. NPDC049419]|uniref:low temperature requirement protein A n=1 Tax=Nonomuraea sp. NPDC049419 TaxID=3155772 RepID=UPI003429654B